MNTIRSLVAVAALLSPFATVAQSWPNLPSTPIAVVNVTDPNFVVTLDDSGSMAWAYVPDSLGSDSATLRFLASGYNPLAYNPFNVYPLPYDPAHVNDSVPSTLSTSFNNAYFNGHDNTSPTVDLRSKYCPTVTYDPSSNTQTYTTGNSNCTSGTTPPWQAAYFYAFYTDVGPNCGANCYTLPTPGQGRGSFTFNTVNPKPANPNKCNGATDTGNDSCYVKVAVPVQHQQNFANWYSFYRTRNLSVVSGANIAFINLNPRYRVTWQSINTCNSGFFSTNCKGWDGVNHTNVLGPFSVTANKTQFYQWLAKLPASGGTPLRTAMIRAGEFYKTTGINSPTASIPGSTVAPISACRPNFHVVLTDGLWNNDSVSAYGNFDNGARTLPDGKSYSSGQHPYSDGYSNTLADIAMNYWATDLQPTVPDNMVPYYPVKTGAANTVAPGDYWLAQNDPATWQHMVNFTIGLGLVKYLNGATDSNNGGQYMPLYGSTTFDGDYPNLVSGSVAWPAPGTNYNSNGNDGNVADLWHAAINSRGEFFSASTPQSVQRAFAKIIGRINTEQTSMGQIGVTTNRVTGSTVALDVKLFPGDGNWYSTLTGYAVYSDGTRNPTAAWTTDTSFTSEAGRRIFTSYGGAGKAFAWNSFTTAEQNTYFAPAQNGIATNLGDQDLFNWLLGVRSTETVNGGLDGNYRKRPQLLGDIVNSDLLITGQDDWGFGFMPNLTSPATPTDSGPARLAYPAFVAGKIPVAFVGANDGMLHAFDTRTGSGAGTEKFAYVPNAVWANSNPLTNLANLASVDYIHQFYVDGPLASYDAYIGGAWKTYLTGGLAGGGKSVFILDVTGPTQSGAQTFAAGNVILEFNNATDSDMGYGFTAPVIGRTVHGDWVAIIANGYGGASCHAVLYVYNLTTKVLSKYDTGNTYGSCTGSPGPNGLSTPTPIQSVAGAISGVYAGDYRGNVWKFNVSASSGAWTIGDATYNGLPFFTASGPNSNQQWITAPITVKKHPAGGLMLLFGTGKFFEANDRADITVQSFYGLRDAGARVSTGRSNLVAQTITSTSLAVGSAKFRTVSNNAVDWSSKNGWYMDLNSTLTSGSGTTASGERVVAAAVLNFDTVLFNTYIPNVNACTGAGSGYLMDLGIFTGGVDPNAPNIDTNGDGVVNQSDTSGAGGMQLGFDTQSGSSTLKSPAPILVTVPPKGNPPPAGNGATVCGGNGQVVCPTPVASTDPPAGCIQPYINNSGICSVAKCAKGYTWVNTGGGGDGICVKGIKQPTWMELN